MDKVKIYWKKYTKNHDWVDYWFMICVIALIPSVFVIAYGVIDAILYSKENSTLSVIDTIYNLLLIVLFLIGMVVIDMLEDFFKHRKQERKNENP